MLTSFFGKSNPFNYFLVSAIILLGYIAWMFLSHDVSNQPQYFIIRTLLILLSIFLILLLDFVIRKNKLTTINTYAIFIFGCLLLMVPHHISDGNIVLANLFLLLAFRRILSIQSDKNLIKKIFDSAIWITIASLFYFWSILFFIVLFTAIGLKKSNKNFKHFLIPVTGMLTVLILVSTFKAINEQDVFWYLHIKPIYSFNLNNYDNSSMLFIAFFMVIMVIWAIIRGMVNYPKLSKKKKPNHILLALILFIGLAISLLAKDKNGTEFFFLFFPLSILLTNTIETLRLRWVKELILWSFIFAPFILFMMN